MTDTEIRPKRWGAVSGCFSFQKPGNHPNFEKNALGVRRPFSEQLSEFRGMLGATLGMALTTHDRIYVKTLFSEQLSERLSELVGHL